MEYKEKRDYVHFYYFWICQYINRFEKQELIKIDNKKNKLLNNFYISYCKNCKNTYKIYKDIFHCNNENEFISKYKHHASIPCLCREECTYRDELNEIYKIRDNEQLQLQLYIGEWKDSIIGKEYSGEEIIIQITDNENDCINQLYDEVERHGSYGINLIGAKDISLDYQGNINSKLIIELDFSVPNDVNFAQLNALKNKKHDSIPTFFTLHHQFDLDEIDYDIEYEIVKTLSGDTFNHKNFKSRALGIYIYDTLHNNIHDKKCKTVKDSIELLSEDMPDVLNILGYGDSELSVFRRLYRKTKECIEKCEVLPMK